MDIQQRHTADLIAEVTRLILNTSTDITNHFTVEEIATIALYLVQHFTLNELKEHFQKGDGGF